MPEELNNGATATATAEPGTGGTSDGGSNLQQQMTGDFFYDDGSDAVVDFNGNPQRDADGNIIRSMDAFEKLGKGQPQQNANQQPGTGKTGKEQGQQAAQKPPAGFDSVFVKDGQFNFDGVMKTSSALKDFSYEMQSTFKPPAPGQGGQQTTVDPKEKIRTTIDGLRQQLTTERLEPIKSIYNGIYQACIRYGQALPAGLLDDIHDAVNTIYLQKNEEISGAIDKRRDELLDEAVTAKTTEADIKAMEQTSATNFKKIADQMIPHVPEDQREDRLSELIFGHKADDGKFVRGYGSDIIEAFFDTAMAGKTFNNPDEWKQAYNQWWFKFSSNPKNIQLVASIAFSRYVAANHSKYRDEYRRAWEKELAEKNKNQNVQSGAGGAVPNETNVADALMDYHRAPKRNL